MKQEEKIALLEEIMDVTEGSLTEETELSEVRQWDSMARISFVSLIDEKFDRMVGFDEIKECLTVNDLLQKME